MAKLLKVPAEAIKNFDEESAINYINTFNDSSVNHGANFNYNCVFNPVDKIVELYEALVKSEKEKVALLQKLLDEKNRLRNPTKMKIFLFRIYPLHFSNGTRMATFNSKWQII